MQAVKLRVEERREAVKELAEEGLSQRGIAGVLGVAEGTIRNDVSAQNYAPIDAVATLAATEKGYGCREGD